MPARETDELVLPQWAPWLVLLPVAVVAVNLYLVASFAWQDPVSDVTTNVSSVRLEAMGRSRVLVSLLPFMLAATLAALFFARDYLVLVGPKTRRRLLISILLFGGVAGLSIWSAAASDPGPEGTVGSNMFDAAFDGLVATGSKLPLRAVLDHLILIFMLFLSIGAGALIVGTISCLAEPPPNMPAAQRQRLFEMQRRRLDAYLYGSALLLVTGLFFMDACMRWPAPFSTNPELYMKHVNELILANGLYYSTIIASYYVPAALWMRRFSLSGAGAPAAGDGAQGADAWSPSRLLKAFLALISPAAAGVLAQLIESAGF